jgi:predicted nucleotidyltransferase
MKQLSLVLVGSVATGLCQENADIDIAIICDTETYASISKGTSWDAGRPSETELDGVRLHYYAMTFHTIHKRLKGLDDVSLYVYSHVVILHDPRNRYARLLDQLAFHASKVRRQRLEGKLDMLLRRSQALESCLAEKDTLAIARICLELIALCLKVIALLDDISFDPRKRLMTTALTKRLGSQVEDKVRALFTDMGDLGRFTRSSHFARFPFPRRLQKIVSILSQEARRQGYRVGLESPDRRHLEK